MKSYVCSLDNGLASFSDHERSSCSSLSSMALSDRAGSLSHFLYWGKLTQCLTSLTSNDRLYVWPLEKNDS